MDKTIFLISYLGGLHGEFLAKLISQDQNYYAVESRSVENNKHQYFDPLYLNNIFIKLSLNHFNYPNRYRKNYKLVTDEQRQSIDLNYSEKNLCVLTHIWQSDLQIFNLPRLKPIRLYCDNDYLLFAFYMAIIKAWILPFPVKDQDLEFLISKVDILTKPYVEKILERRSYFWIERLAISKKQFDLNVLIKFYFNNIYKQSNTDAQNKKHSGWEYLDVGSLMKDPETHQSIFRDSLNLSTNMPVEKISDYHRTNLSLIENKFNLTYSRLKYLENQFDIIKDYILENTDKDFWLR